ncbi:hypothetical protein LOK49_LG08G00687, partial [Camellia lanceoleosa]
MGISKTEINLRRLLATASHQQNQAKLIHYVATLREQLEQLVEERTSDGLPSFKSSVNDYSRRLKPLCQIVGFCETLHYFIFHKESPLKAVGESSIPISPELRRRFVAPSNIEDRPHDSVVTDYSAPVKLDAISFVIITADTSILLILIPSSIKKLQDDLTDEMVGLAQQLKESSLMMSQSLENTEK